MGRQKYTIPDQKSVTYGIPAEEIALRCGVSLRTACRWKSGAVEMDLASKMVLAGDLGCFAPEWSGWVIRHGCLVSPENWTISVNDVLAVRLMAAQISAYQSENRALKAALAESERGGYEDQPNPAELGEIFIKVS